MRDFGISTHEKGTIALIHPQTPRAHEWLKKNCDNDKAHFYGDALCVTGEVLPMWIEGLTEIEGFEVEELCPN